MKKQIIITGCLLFTVFCVKAQIISTIAGNGIPGYVGDGVAATLTQLNLPQGISIDASGNLYISDFSNNRIRKVSPSGIISTIAGNGIPGFSGDNDTAINAQLNHPSSVAVDVSGNVYIADSYNQRIRKVNTSGIITTIAGTGAIGYGGSGVSATIAQFNYPVYLALDNFGNIYISDQNNNRIRKINNSGIITTIAGTGVAGYGGDSSVATSAELNSPAGLTIDTSGNVYFADLDNQRIRKITASGIITTFAGTGTFGYSGDLGMATMCELHNPSDVAVDGSGNVYITSDYGIRKVDISGIITTVAGTGLSAGYSGDSGAATSAQVNSPNGIAISASGDLYISDSYNSRIRFVSYSSSIIPSFKYADEKIKLFPNPNNGTFSIYFSSTVEEKVHFVISDIFGREMKEFTDVSNQMENMKINLPVGLYMLSAITANGSYTAKITVTANIPK